VPVTYLPDYCVAEVAEHALALLLALARGIVKSSYLHLSTRDCLIREIA